jgi:hypothetical protein
MVDGWLCTMKITYSPLPANAKCIGDMGCGMPQYILSEIFFVFIELNTVLINCVPNIRQGIKLSVKEQPTQHSSMSG